MSLFVEIGGGENMKQLRKALQQEIRENLERKRLLLFEIRKRDNRQQNRCYVQLTETIDCLDARKRTKGRRRNT